MKTDRFVKVMLVIIAGLLFLNCVKDVSFNNSNSPTTSKNDSTQSPNPTKTSTVPFIETSVEAASIPAFIQVGKTYDCATLQLHYISTDGLKGFKVTVIDSNSGWIKGEKSWVNTANLYSCVESSPQNN